VTSRLQCIPFIVGTLALTILPAHAELSGPQVMERCRKAYEALKSYHGVSRVHSIIKVSGKPSTYDTHATIQFARPGKIHVEGITMFGASSYAYLSDGETTWFRNAAGEPWKRVQSAEIAVLSANGWAGTTIPATLLSLKNRSPFKREITVARKVVTAKVGDQPVYRVEVDGDMGKQTYSIDQKSLMILRIHTHNKKSGQFAGSPPGVEMDVEERFTVLKLNSAIPAKVFVKP
jgi:outer membrane lipoprotein-sorting protein